MPQTTSIPTPEALGLVDPYNNRYLKEPKISTDYIPELEKMSKLASNQKRQLLAATLALPNGIQKLGEAFVGPILLKLKYQGLLRDVLVETPLAKGEPPEYDVMDDLGSAYMLNVNEGEVMVTMFEGKRVYLPLFRIAAFPKVRKEDLYALKMDAVEYAQNESKIAIQKQEDSYLWTLLETAIDDYASNPNHTVTPNQQHTIQGNTPFAPEDLYGAAGVTASHELEPTRLIMNVQDYYTLLTFTTEQVGWDLKNKMVAGQEVTTFGPYLIKKSITVTKGTLYVLPDPEYLGYFPVRYSLDVEEDPMVEKFHKGWVMDEYVGMSIINPRGLVRIIES